LSPPSPYPMHQVDQQEARRNTTPPFRGDQTFSLLKNQPHHGPTMSFDATGGLDEFTRSFTNNRGPAVETGHFQRQVVRQGSTITTEENVSLQGMTDGDANINDGNINNNHMFMKSSTPTRPGAGSATERVGQDTVPRNRHGAPGERDLSPLPRQEQPWYQMSQSSKRARHNCSVDRIDVKIGGTSMERYLHTPEGRHTPLKDNDEAAPTDKKRKRSPYRCKWVSPRSPPPPPDLSVFRICTTRISAQMFHFLQRVDNNHFTYKPPTVPWKYAGFKRSKNRQGGNASQQPDGRCGIGKG